MKSSSYQWQRNKFKFSKSIIFNHINLRILYAFLGVMTLLSLIFLSNGFYLYLQESMIIGYSQLEVMHLVFLRLLREFPIIITFAFIVSTLLIINRMYRNSESIILHSAGLNEFNFFKRSESIFLVILSLSLIFTNFISPKIRLEISQIQDIAKNRPSYLQLTESRFLKFNNGDTVFYADKVFNEGDNQKLENIRIFRKNPNEKLIISAKKGIKKIDPESLSVYLDLFNGQSFIEDHGEYSSVKFDRNRVKLYSPDQTINYKSNSIETLDSFELFNSDSPKAFLEFIFRLSISILLISMYFLTLSISKTHHRKKGGVYILIVVITFLIYYNSLEAMKNSLELSESDSVAGIISIHFLFLFINLLTYRFKRFIF